MLPVQLAMPLALLVGAAIAATTDPSRSENTPATIQTWADGQAEMRMLRISIEPGASLPWHMPGGTAGPRGATVVVFYTDVGGDPAPDAKNPTTSDNSRVRGIGGRLARNNRP